MAIKDLVTLGIGCSPGSIKYLLLVGLDISAVIISAERTYDVDAEVRTWAIPAEVRIYSIDLENRTLEV